MMKKWSSMLLALCLLLSLIACASSGTAAEPKDEKNVIECPIPGVEWGMTKAEVWEVLTSQGESEETLEPYFMGEQTNCGSVKPQHIGWEDPKIAGMGLAYYDGDVTNYRGANFVFCPPVNGEQYLVSIILSLRAENEEAYHKALTEAYGEPALLENQMFMWISDDYGNELDEATLKKYEEAGLRLLPYYGEALQTWHIKPVVYPWWFSLDEEDIVDGMQNFITEFNATQYVVAMMLEKGIVLKL